MKFEDISEGKIKIGSTTYNMVEAKYGGAVVWPTGQPVVVVSYAVLSAGFSYSSGYRLNASGTNYGIATGTVQEYHNGEPYGSPFTAALSARLPSGSPLTLVGDKIYGPSLGTYETSEESYRVLVCYDQSAYVESWIVQEPNVKTRTGINSKVYDYSSSVTTESDTNYYLESFTATPYNGTSYPCPASGGTSTLSYYAGHTHEVVVTTPWTRTANYSYTSGATSTEPYDSGTEITSQTSTQVADTPTITGSATGFTRSGNEVTIANRGTNNNDQESSAARYVTYTATNGNVTDTVTIYQAHNIPQTTYTYESDIEIDYGSSEIPAAGDGIGLVYTSRRSGVKAYPSGSSITLSTEPYSATLRVYINNVLQDTYTVSGFGGQQYVVGANNTGSTRTISVTLNNGVTAEVSDSITQAAPVAPWATATMFPYIFESNAGPYLKGKTYYVVSITGGNMSSITLTNVWYYYTLNGLNYSKRIGTLTLTDTGSNLVELVSQYDSIPTFQTGDIITDAYFSGTPSESGVTMTFEPLEYVIIY